MRGRPDSGEPPGLSVAELEARLREAEETLEAIRNGDVDAVVVGGPAGQQVYTLENADRPYRVLIEQMQEGAVTLSDEGTVLYCNQRFAWLVATPRVGIIGGLFSRFFATGEVDAFRQLLARDSDAGAAGEFTLMAAGGTAVPVNISLVDLRGEEGLARVVCGVVTDLTHNRARSHELAAANARLASEIDERRRAEGSLKLALDAAGMGSWDLDLATGDVRRSLRHDQIFGHPQLLPAWSLETWLEHFLPDDRAAVAQAFARAQTTGLIELEARIGRADDRAPCWLRLVGQTHYAAALPVRIAGVIEDVTDRRALEEQLRQAQKMEAVGQLTGGIAHDFNNLLTIIGGSLDILARRITPDEKTSCLLDAASQGVARGAKLNQQLLAFARRQDLRTEVICVDRLIPTFEHLLQRAVGEAVTVEIELASAVWMCRADPHQLEAAILNLVINGRDAMPNGGVLKLATGNRTIADHVAIGWGAAGGDYVVVTVADTGVGMAPEIATRAFEPFFTTKEIGKGSGLGLSQVYGFAKQSGGFVTIDSKLGRGTAVAVHLPRTHQEKAEDRPLGPSIKPDEAGRGVVLVVEDDPDVRATASLMLRDLGYTVREAESGRAALDMIERGQAVDLVFSDVVMPDGVSGIELARELGVRRPSLPVLLASGYMAQRAIPEALAKDVRLLQKPYLQRDLARSIKEAFDARVEGDP